MKQTNQKAFTFYNKFSAILDGKRVTLPDQITTKSFKTLTEFPVIKMDGTKVIIKKVNNMKPIKKGRPAKYKEPVLRGSIRIPKSEMDTLLKIGDGSINEGVRLAIKIYRLLYPHR